jgi:hypothetical protein
MQIANLILDFCSFSLYLSIFYLDIRFNLEVIVSLAIRDLQFFFILNFLIYFIKIKFCLGHCLLNHNIFLNRLFLFLFKFLKNDRFLLNHYFAVLYLLLLLNRILLKIAEILAKDVDRSMFLLVHILKFPKLSLSVF